MLGFEKYVYTYIIKLLYIKRLKKSVLEWHLLLLLLYKFGFQQMIYPGQKFKQLNLFYFYNFLS